MVTTDHFSNDELKCKCGCDHNGMKKTFMSRIETLRVEVDEPLLATSAYRCPEYDSKIGGAGVHPTGNGIDLKCSGALARKVNWAAERLGFRGIGISQRGPHGKRFIHLDDIDSPSHPRPWVWSY